MKIQSIIYPDQLDDQAPYHKEKNKLIGLLATQSGIKSELIVLIDEQLTGSDLSSRQKQLICQSYQHIIKNLLPTIVTLQKKLHFTLQLNAAIFTKSIVRAYAKQLKYQDLNYQDYVHVSKQKITNPGKLSSTMHTYEEIPEVYKSWILDELKKDHNQTDTFLLEQFKKQNTLGYLSDGSIKKMFYLVRSHHNLKKSIATRKLQQKIAKKHNKSIEYKTTYDNLKNILLDNPHFNNIELYQAYQDKFGGLNFTLERARGLYFLPLRAELSSVSDSYISKKGVKQGPKEGYDDLDEHHIAWLKQHINNPTFNINNIVDLFYDSFEEKISSHRIKAKITELRSGLGNQSNRKAPKGYRAKLFTVDVIEKIKQMILAGAATNIEIFDSLNITDKKKKRSVLSQISFIRRITGIQAVKGNHAISSYQGKDVVGTQSLTYDMKIQIIDYLKDNPNSLYKDIISHLGLHGCSANTVNQFIRSVKNNNGNATVLVKRKQLELYTLELLQAGKSSQDIITILGEKYSLGKSFSTYLSNISLIHGVEKITKKQFSKVMMKKVVFPIYDNLTIDTLPDLIKKWGCYQYDLRADISDTFMIERFQKTFKVVLDKEYMVRMIGLVKQYYATMR